MQLNKNALSGILGDIFHIIAAICFMVAMVDAPAWVVALGLGFCSYMLSRSFRNTNRQ